MLIMASLGPTLAGCRAVSPYHLARTQKADGRLAYNLVAHDAVAAMAKTEDAWAHAFAGGHFDRLRPDLAPRAARELTPARWNDIRAYLKNRYRLDGTAAPLRVTPAGSVAGSRLSRDPLATYDMISCFYELGGDPPAVLELFYTRIDGSVRISGFRLADRDTNPAGNNPPLSHVYPETTGRSRRPRDAK